MSKTIRQWFVLAVAGVTFASGEFSVADETSGDRRTRADRIDQEADKAVRQVKEKRSKAAELRAEANDLVEQGSPEATVKAKREEANRLDGEADDLHRAVATKRAEAQKLRLPTDSAAPAPTAGAPEVANLPPRSSFFPPLFMHAGFRLLNPYQIRTDTNSIPKRFFIETGETDVVGFLEVQLTTRWTERVYRSLASDGTVYESSWLWFSPDVHHTDRYGIDFDVRGGINLGGKSDSAATMIQTGSAYTEASIGLPVYRQVFAAPPGELPITHSVNLDVNGGFNVSRAFSEVHPTVGVGLATVWGIPVTQSNRYAQVISRIGFGWLDAPNLVSSNQSQLEVVNNRGVPDYKIMESYSALFEARIPVQESAWLTFSARFHNSEADPDLWTMSLAYTLPLDLLLTRVSDLISPQRN